MKRAAPIRAGILAVLAACGARAEADPALEAARQDRVAEAGADVMPFDLDATTHVFEKLADGGLQQVYADDEPEQVALIRGHLEEEAERFARGDFHDPAAVHGHDMPGLHQLVTGHERISIEYDEIPRGGQIRYNARDPEMVAAIHAWFDAQLRDHGDHARDHR